MSWWISVVQAGCGCCWGGVRSFLSTVGMLCKCLAGTAFKCHVMGHCITVGLCPWTLKESAAGKIYWSIDSALGWHRIYPCAVFSTALSHPISTALSSLQASRYYCVCNWRSNLWRSPNCLQPQPHQSGCPHCAGWDHSPQHKKVMARILSWDPAYCPIWNVSPGP